MSSILVCMLLQLVLSDVTAAFQPNSSMNNVAVVSTVCDSVMNRHINSMSSSSSIVTRMNGKRRTMPLDSAASSVVAAAVGNVKTVVPNMLASLRSMQSVAHLDPFYCLTGILALSTFGVVLEKRTTIGKALSAPLATMALALGIANLGVLPFTSPVYSAINTYFVPLAVPLLLFDSNIRRVISDTGSLLACFGVGAMATIIGTLIAFPIVPMRGLGPSAWKVACALTARHIGGAINFVAVAETLQIPGTIVSAAIAADNVVVALYFATIFSLAIEGEEPSNSSSNAETINLKDVESEGSGLPTTSTNDINLATLATSLTVSAGLVTCGKFVTKAIFPGTSALPITSVLTVLAATIRPQFFMKIRNAGTALGILFIQLFFAASGAAGSIALVFQQAPALFAFSALQVSIHFAVLMTLGRGLFRLQPNELYLASNANVGGPTTAASMAQAKNWHRLVLPALLVGILGYASATCISLALGPILKRMVGI